MNDTRYYGMYRGIVKDNSGEKGQVKIFVPTIYPSEFENVPTSLPWAEPAQSLFGGNFSSDGSTLNTETGIAGWPKIGAFVWVFFDQGDHNFPIYFASCQAGDGWISQHNKQWVVQTDNLRIRIDENPSDAASTSKFDTYNSENTYESRTKQKLQVPTLLDIEAKGNVNLKITGNVNLQINGTLYEEINGNIHRTHIGNLYERHVGDKRIVHDGSTAYENNGNTLNVINGNLTLNRTGTETKIIDGSENKVITNVKSLNVGKQYVETINNKSSKVIGTNDETTIGTKVEFIDGDYKITVNNNYIEIINSNSTSSIKGSRSITVNGNCTTKSSGIYQVQAAQIRLN
jgi:hypothetical protein